METRGNAVLLTPPEAGSLVALVDVETPDAEAAVREAWKASGREVKWAVKTAEDLPPRDGWEQIRQVRYETSANEQRFVIVQALRSGGRWTVAILDMPEALFEKRLAQVLLVIDKLLPAGYSRESFAGKTAHTLDAARLAALREFVGTAQRALGVPGVSVGVVQDGKVVLAEGFGVRELGKSEPVDAATLYMIASNTKSLTTLMLARLADQGKLTWKTPVAQLLPEFALGDPETTRRVLVEHLVCACTGLPRQDFEWLMEYAGATPATTLRTLATMKPTSDFGALYQYSNPLASAGGYVGGHALYPDMELGAAYDRAMQTQVFDPLGMRDTTFDFARALAGNHASPHAWDVDGRPATANMPINYAVVPMRPAGGAWSSVRDLLRYVQMELDGGAPPGGDRYVSAAALFERRAPKVAIGNDVHYGMGLGVDRTWGVTVVNHGGSMIGYKSDMLWLPEHGVGAVILTNSDEGNWMLGSFQRRLLELLFDGKPEAAEDVAAAAERIKARRAAERPRLALPADAAAAGKLAAAYHNDALGDVTVERDGGRTVFDFGEWESEVASRRNDDGSLSFVTASPGIAGIELVVADQDGARRLVVRAAQQEYVFTAQ